MRKGTTTDGFAFEIDEARMDDMRVVDVLSIVIDDDASPADRFAGASRLTSMLIGDDQKKALYRHIGEKHGGRVPLADFNRDLLEIMQAGAGKDAVKN